MLLWGTVLTEGRESGTFVVSLVGGQRLISKPHDTQPAQHIPSGPEDAIYGPSWTSPSSQVKNFQLMNIISACLHRVTPCIICKSVRLLGSGLVSLSRFASLHPMVPLCGQLLSLPCPACLHTHTLAHTQS